MNRIHREEPSHREAKALRQGATFVSLDEADREWEPSASRELNSPHADEIDHWRPHPEQPQSVWDHVLNLGREATRERMFA